MHYQPNLQKYKGYLLFALTLLVLTNLSGQSDLSSEQAFLFKLRLDTVNTDNYCDEYVYRFKHENYRLYKNDEFEMREALNHLNDKVINLTLKDVYAVNYTSAFNTYDFGKNGFEFSPLSEDLRFNLLDFAFGVRLSTNSSIDLRFLNSEEIDFLPVAPEKAEMLIKQRKNYKNGKVDRSIDLRISYIISGLEKSENVTSKINYTLTAKILQIDFFDKTEGNNEVLASVKTSFKKEYDERMEFEAQLEKSHQEPETAGVKQVKTDSELVLEVQSIINNSSISNELKSILIESTIKLYQANTTSEKKTVAAQ